MVPISHLRIKYICRAMELPSSFMRDVQYALAAGNKTYQPCAYTTLEFKCNVQHDHTVGKSVLASLPVSLHFSNDSQ